MKTNLKAEKADLDHPIKSGNDRLEGTKGYVIYRRQIAQDPSDQCFRPCKKHKQVDRKVCPKMLISKSHDRPDCPTLISNSKDPRWDGFMMGIPRGFGAT
jgi:hypothetical protein